MEQFKEQLKNARAAIEAARAAYNQQAAAAFNIGTLSIFRQHPTLQAFRWSQGTPGFCDGDPCYFRVHDDPESIHLRVDDEDYDSDDYNDERYDDVKDQVANLLATVGGDLLEDVFGDSVEVTAKRDGTFDVDDYDMGY